LPYETIIKEKKGFLAFVFLNRPQVSNALNLTLAQELTNTCQEINDDPVIRAVIVTGVGEVFSIGAEVPWSRPPGAGDLLTLIELRHALGLGAAFSALANIPSPVIGALNGDALAEGLELALCCDLRLASQTARFGLPHTALGLIPSAGGTQRLPRIVGRGKALEMILTADPIDAQEALRIGLVSRVVPQGELLSCAEELAHRIAQRGPIAVRYAKEAMLKGLDMTLDQGLRLEADLSLLLQSTQDRNEGIRAFLEKRTPQFKGE